MIDGMSVVFRQRMERKLEDRIGEERLALSSGSCKTLEQYKEKCGYIRALTEIVGMMDKVAQDLSERK